MSTPTLSAKRSLAAFPAGSNGEFGLPDNDAIVIQRGEGCELWDATGRRYLDFSMGWGSALIGHGRREVADAVRKQCFDGFNFAYVTQSSVELAEEIIRISPACQQLRFCSSGSEATQYCARIARAATGRSTLMKFEGAYHGSHVIGVANLFLEQPPDYPLAVSNCDGCRHAERDLLIAPFNDLEVTTRIAEEYQSQLAGVIVEPLQRCLPPAPGFLEGLRELTQRLDIPLIFDEVVTGFRLAYGGAQEYYEVIPDLVAYGKALGGGFPIGAYGGRAELMNLVREDRLGSELPYVWSASSTGGNPISSAAASATLDVLRTPNTYEHLQHLGEYFRQRLRQACAGQDVTAQIIGDGPLAQMVFTDAQPVDYRSSRHQHSGFARAVMLGLFRRGIFLNPMGTKLYLSLAHNEAICDEFCDVLGRVLEAAKV